MRDAPSERDVVDKEFRQPGCGRSGVGVAPGPEGHEYFAVGSERHIAVHHGADADCCKMFDLYIEIFAHICAQVGIGVLQAIPDSFCAVGPKPVGELVFPFMTALGYRLVLSVDQYGFDSGGSQFDSEDRLALFDCCFRIKLHFIC